jgi:hypothetical protein
VSKLERCPLLSKSGEVRRRNGLENFHSWKRKAEYAKLVK